MNTTEIKEILEQHKIWVTSFGKKGLKADLCGADLCDANLSGAKLPASTFIILGEIYFISITNGESVRAGCQCHPIKNWRKFSKQEIAEMGGKRALRFHPRLLDIIDFYCGKGERPGWLQEEDVNEHNTD